MNDREQAQTAMANLLLERVRQDRYPSTVHMELLELTLPPSLRRDYVNILLEKVVSENHPSIPMMQRIIRISARL